MENAERAEAPAAIGVTALSPGGWLVLSGLVLAFVASVLGVARCRRWFLQALAALVAFTMAAAAGVGGVNAYYGYYTTWSALAGDLRADNGVAAIPVRIPVTATGAPTRVEPVPSSAVIGRWTVRHLALPGPVSGVQGRSGLVVLPPAAARSGPLPVLILLHGEPGEPSSWTGGLQIATVLQREAALGLVGPLVVVLPDVSGGFRDQQCLDAAGGPRLATYLAQDVPRDVAAALPVATPGSAWGIGGLSEGAFCASDVALHRPSSWGAVAVLDGYFRPDVTRAVVRRVYYGQRSRASADDVQALAQSAEPLPAFWVMAGTRNAQDYHRAVSFATALGRRQSPRFVTVIGGRHTTPAWRTALPDLLRWASAELRGHGYGGSIDLPLE